MTYIDSTHKYLTDDIEIMIDTRTNQTVSMQTQYCKSNTFTNDIQTLSDTQVLAYNTDGGTSAIRTITISSTPSNYFSNGDTVYYRSKITAVSGSGTAAN
jgi:hypothetical protein